MLPAAVEPWLDRVGTAGVWDNLLALTHLSASTVLRKVPESPSWTSACSNLVLMADARLSAIPLEALALVTTGDLLCFSRVITVSRTLSCILP
mmetsp:Transcript_91996/g.239970  ORF Transcript_91996/g.239970 Transcript_91996/m.239970 type:complete len:93 (-) Transcript_91996:112-390(-)